MTEDEAALSSDILDRSIGSYSRLAEFVPRPPARGGNRMPLENDVLLKIEELKEAGHEYRYREQIMVQEFGLSMLATAAAAGVIGANEGTGLAFAIQVIGLAFLALLTLHLRNVNQDRYAALHVKEAIRVELGFRPIHRNTGGRRRGTVSMSATLAIVRFAFTLTVLWGLWLVSVAGTAVRSLG